MRRLPVLQNKAADDDAAETRPAWHWVLIGSMFVVSFMLPLWIAASWIPRWLARAAPSLDVDAAGLASLLVAFALGVGASGALVGRFAGRPGVAVPALGGALGGGLLFLIGLVFGELSLPAAFVAVVVLASAGALFAALGGALGLRARPK